MPNWNGSRRFLDFTLTLARAKELVSLLKVPPTAIIFLHLEVLTFRGESCEDDDCANPTFCFYAIRTPRRFIAVTVGVCEHTDQHEAEYGSTIEQRGPTAASSAKNRDCELTVGPIRESIHDGGVATT